MKDKRRKRNTEETFFHDGMDREAPKRAHISPTFSVMISRWQPAAFKDLIINCL